MSVQQIHALEDRIDNHRGVVPVLLMGFLTVLLLVALGFGLFTWLDKLDKRLGAIEARVTEGSGP